MARQPDHRAQLLTAYAAATARIRARVEQFVLSTWDGLDNHRSADIARLVKAVVPVVGGAQSQVAALTDAYLSRVAADVLGGPTRVAGVREAGQNPRGVDPREVYTRPGITVWTALSVGKSYTDAVKAGRERLVDLAVTDIQLSKTHTARAVFQKDSRVSGYARVLGGGDNCDLCVEASNQTYRTEDLMPIHPGCGCDVEALYGTEAPDQATDEETPDVDVAVREHGEMGPLLTVRSQEFTGPDEIDT